MKYAANSDILVFANAITATIVAESESAGVDEAYKEGSFAAVQDEAKANKRELYLENAKKPSNSTARSTRLSCTSTYRTRAQGSAVLRLEYLSSPATKLQTTQIITDRGSVRVARN